MTHPATYVRLLHRSEQSLADSLRVVGVGHAAEADVFHTAHLLADWSDEHTAGWSRSRNASPRRRLLRNRSG